MENTIQYESVDYGTYVLEDEAVMFSEAVAYDKTDFNKLYMRKLALPKGKGNIIYLMSDTFLHSLEMIKSGNVFVPTSYRKVWYPTYSAGTFMKKRYRFSTSKEKPERNKLIKDVTGKIAYSVRKIPSSTDNLFIVTTDIYDAVIPMVGKYSAKRLYEEFVPEYVRIIQSMTPAAQEGPADSFNRIVMIDAERFSFKPSAPLKENKLNPLYLLYLAYFRTRDLSKLNMDVDMLITSKNLFMKFNPSKLAMDKWNTFRRFLFRIINANLDDYTDKLSEEEKKEIQETGTDKVVANIVNKSIAPYTNNVQPSTKIVVQNAVKAKLEEESKNAVAKSDELKAALGDIESDSVFNKSNITSVLHANGPLNKKKEDLFKLIGGYQSLSQLTGDMIDEMEDDIADDSVEILQNDKEIAEEAMDEIQDHTVPLNHNNSPVNSKRDEKLREEQKKVVVQNETIEQILSRDANTVKIETEDKSKVMHTSNENMKKVTFANFDKTYLDELYMKDLVSCFDALKDKDSPFFITNIDIKDTSTALDYKDTWTVGLKDELGKKHTIKVDIPKFRNDRFMLINGTQFIILKQNFYNPLVKDTPDTVIVTTNYNKITVTRKATKSLSSIERIFALIKKSADNGKVFTIGDSSKANMKYISSLEYDELSRRLFSFKTDNCEIYFSREYLKEHMPEDIKMSDDEFFIGIEKGNPIIINEDTGKDKYDRTITDIMVHHMPESYFDIYKTIKAPAQSMYAMGKLAGEFIPIITTLTVWNGLSKSLDMMKINWKFDSNMKRLPKDTSSTNYIRFSDGVLSYQANTFTELVLNGLLKMHPEDYKFEEFDTGAAYEDFVYAQWGSYNGINELLNFKEFLIDPITKDVCKDMMLPSDPSGLLLHAVKLLCDNAYVSKANDRSYRVRSIEMIPAILYGCISAQYKAYVKSGRRTPMTLNQRCVIQKLLAEKTVEPYSTLNPVVEVSKTHTISTKGYKGSNSEHSYDEEKRSYDPTSVGKIAMTSSPDANVGINHSLVIEPTISNARGYRDPVDNVEDLDDVNIFAPTEMLTPGTIRGDDAIRSAIAVKQSSHVVPVADAVPSLISNGYDEAVQFHLSDDFVINAEEDGKVVEYNEEVGFVMVQYKSGKTKAIPLNPEIVKNSGAGFYLANQLTPTHIRVGETFKKDEPLAYHAKYFNYSKANGLRYNIGPLCKVAFCSSYNTYEDSGIATQSLSERMKSSIVYMESGKFSKNNNILSMVKVGDHVAIGDSLIKFNVSTEDNELAKYLSKLNDDNAALLTDESQSDIKSSHAGKIIAIKVYTLLPPESLSPSLGQVVQAYFDKAEAKKKFLDKYDSTDSTMKAGYLITDSPEPIKNRYNSIKGIKTDVLIEIYIEHADTLGTGDKLALYGPNKVIVGTVIAKGYEPYSEFRPDEEVSTVTSPGTIARRMTASALTVAATGKVLVELKRKIGSVIKYK